MSFSNWDAVKEQCSQLISHVQHDLTTTVSASIAIGVTFHGFRIKGAEQVEREKPIFSLTKNISAMPTIGGIVSTQILAERCIRGFIEGSCPSEVASVISLGVTSLVSAPLLKGFSGQSLDEGFIESMKRLTIKETGAIFMREMSFLAAVRLSEPLSTHMREKYGDTKFVEQGSVFGGAVVSSVVGHPFDTIVARLQSNMPIDVIKNPRQLMLGLTARTYSIGAFTLIYYNTKKYLEYTE